MLPMRPPKKGKSGAREDRSYMERFESHPYDHNNYNISNIIITLLL